MIAGIKRDDPSNDIYAWEETDPKDIAWEYEDDFRDAYEEQDKKGQKKAAGRFQKYWESSMQIRNTVLCGLRNGRMNRGTTVL